jgi:START domain
MSIETVELPQPPKSVKSILLKRLLKWSVILLLVLTSIIFIAHVFFMYSGNRKWELISNKQGVNVYSMKVSGDNLKKFKAIFRVKATLSTIIAFMQDNDSDLDIDFYDARELEKIGPQEMVTQWKSKLPSPFKPRDFVVRHMFAQDPERKTIIYTLQSLPNRIPLESCCVRVPRMDNDWVIIPQNDGTVEIQWFIDMDVGGMMPYFLMNSLHPDIMTDFASHLQGYLNRPKYRNAKIAWISEPNTAPAIQPQQPK